MGVYIPNKDKPKSCYTCTFRIIDPIDGNVCGCVVGHIQGIPLDQDRADDCPLIEIDERILETAIKLAKLNRTMAEVEANEDKYIESNATQRTQCVESVEIKPVSEGI